jgi:hypothetical protein
MKFRYDTLVEEKGMIEKYSKLKKCTSRNMNQMSYFGAIPGVSMFVEKVYQKAEEVPSSDIINS